MKRGRPNKPHSFTNTAMSGICGEEDCYIALAAAIVIQAKEDFKEYWNRWLETADGSLRSHYSGVMKSIYRSFHSKHFSILCFGRNVECFERLVEYCQIHIGRIPEGIFTPHSEENFEISLDK